MDCERRASPISMPAARCPPASFVWPRRQQLRDDRAVTYFGEDEDGMNEMFDVPAPGNEEAQVVDQVYVEQIKQLLNDEQTRFVESAMKVRVVRAAWPLERRPHHF